MASLLLDPNFKWEAGLGQERALKPRAHSHFLCKIVMQGRPVDQQTGLSLAVTIGLSTTATLFDATAW